MDGALVVHGVDVIDLEDFKRVLAPSMESELNRLFTEAELADAGSSDLRAERLAGRFAVKEAVMKALRRGFGDGIAFIDVETANDHAGAPSIRLHRELAAEAMRQGVTDWLVSTSHSGNVVFASVIGVRRD